MVVVAGRVRESCCRIAAVAGRGRGSCRRVEIGRIAGCRKVESGAGLRDRMIVDHRC